MQRKGRLLSLGWALVGLAAVWGLLVMFSGGGWNPSGVKWNFENTGELGDSFGILSSVMAGIAAYYAFRTYQGARDDSARLERGSAEATYLNLLERRYDVLNRVRMVKTIHNGDRRQKVDVNGQAVLDEIAHGLQLIDATMVETHYKAILSSSVWGLGNFYRFTYHVINFADRRFGGDDANHRITKDDLAYELVRLLRAQMSNSELILVALNCIYGEGFAKFKPLVERYALLHNIEPSAIKHFALRDHFAAEAFGLNPEDQYGDARGALSRE